MRVDKTLGASVVALLFAITVVACGGGNGDSAAGNSPAPSPQTTGPTVSGGAPNLSDLFRECVEGADFTLSAEGDVTVATDKDSGHTFRIQRFASEAEAAAHVKGLKTQAKAQAGPLVAVGDNDDAFKVMAPLTGCLNAEHLTNR